MDLLRGRLSIVFKSLSFQHERFVYNKYEDSRCAKRSKYIFYLHLFSLLFYFFYRLEDKISKSMSVWDEIDNELGAKKMLQVCSPDTGMKDVLVIDNA